MNFEVALRTRVLWTRVLTQKMNASRHIEVHSTRWYRLSKLATTHSCKTSKVLITFGLK